MNKKLYFYLLLVLRSNQTNSYIKLDSIKEKDTITFNILIDDSIKYCGTDTLSTHFYDILKDFVDSNNSCINEYKDTACDKLQNIIKKYISLDDDKIDITLIYLLINFLRINSNNTEQAIKMLIDIYKEVITKYPNCNTSCIFNNENSTLILEVKHKNIIIYQDTNYIPKDFSFKILDSILEEFYKNNDLLDKKVANDSIYIAGSNNSIIINSNNVKEQNFCIKYGNNIKNNIIIVSDR